MDLEASGDADDAGSIFAGGESPAFLVARGVARSGQGRFTRQLQLGENLDIQNVEARYANGVLHLTIPVAEAAQPRRIEVQGAGTTQTIVMSPGQGSAEPGSGDEQ